MKSGATNFRAPKNVDKTDFKYDIWSNQKVVSMQSTVLLYTEASSISWRIEIDVCVFCGLRPLSVKKDIGLKGGGRN